MFWCYFQIVFRKYNIAGVIPNEYNVYLHCLVQKGVKKVRKLLEISL